MLENITFSILMANYNNGKYIKEAIESVISQTYPNYELIIIDDASTDNSIDIIKPFLNDERIKLIRLSLNIGYGGALKIAEETAANEILGILDSDDKLHEKALEIMAEAYQKNLDCGFIYSTMWNCDEKCKNCKINEWIGPIFPKKSMILNPKISHFKTFKKEAYNLTTGFSIFQKRAVDKDIIYKLEEVTKFKFIHKPLYYYRLNESGISQAKNKFQARVYLYIAKCKAYKRRLNMNIPNIDIKDLYLEFLKLSLYRQIKFFKYLISLFKIKFITKNFSKTFPTLFYKLKQIFLIGRSKFLMKT